MPAECRICLKMKREVSSLFSKDNDSQTNDARIYAEKLTEFASIQISKNDGMTDSICGVCIRTLRSVFVFRQLCRDSDVKLRKRIGLSSVDTVETVEYLEKDRDDVNNFFATTADISDVVTIKHEQLEFENNDHFDNSFTIEPEEGSDVPETDPNALALKRMNPDITIVKIEEEVLDVPETDPNALALKRMNPDITIVKIEAANIKKAPTRKPRRRKNLELDDTSPNKIYRKRKSDFIQGTFKVKNEWSDTLTTFEGEPLPSKPNCPSKVITTLPKIHQKRQYFCEICGKCFDSRTILESHLQRHAGIKPHQCSDCGKAFVMKSELRRHSFIHTGVRPYPCRFCGRAFADYSSKIKHERCHLNERAYKCDVCGNGFNYSYALKKHMLVHSGAKNFFCTLCKQSFRSKCNLNNHIKARHKDLDCLQKERLLKMGDLLAAMAQAHDENQTNTIDNFNIKVVNDEKNIPQVYLELGN